MSGDQRARITSASLGGRVNKGQPARRRSTGADDLNTARTRTRSARKSSRHAPCQICHRIAEVFQLPANHPRHRGYHTASLGSRDEVLGPSRCTVHSRLICSALKVSPRFVEDFAKVTSFSISRYALDWPVATVIFTGHTAGGTKALSSCDLHLLGSPQDGHVAVGGKLVDDQWIDVNLIHRWKDECFQKHLKCRQRITERLGTPTVPAWLVDCQRCCLIPGAPDKIYVALSYVWGGHQSVMTLRKNLSSLQKDGQLETPGVTALLPQTMKDAMKLTIALRERYLWIDALCIVQDEERLKDSQIMHMPWIYENAVLTIVAKGGNANAGLPGLLGISSPRSMNQQKFRLREDTWCIMAERGRGSRKNSTWETRGWTFQERMFSRRCLTFHDQTVTWECLCERWHEDVDFVGTRSSTSAHWSPLNAQPLCTSAYPDTNRLRAAINDYNVREFTYPIDVYKAFVGVMLAASHAFRGGFLSGLPVQFFDQCLLWQPAQYVKRRMSHTERVDAPSSQHSHNLFPSWSWLGWKGLLDNWVWVECTEFIKKHTTIRSPSHGVRSRSLVEWYYQDPTDLSYRRINFEQRIDQRELCYQARPTPKGWKRHDVLSFYNQSRAKSQTYDAPDIDRSPSYYFTPADDNEAEFWYPPSQPPSDKPVPEPRLVQIIRCRTRRAHLYAAERIIPGRGMITLRNEHDVWAGCLYPHSEACIADSKDDSHRHGLFGKKLELVEISTGYCIEGDSQGGITDMLVCSERPKGLEGSRFHFYNVMWIEWQNDVAYRQGLGSVAQSVWEALEREWIDLVLG